MAFKTRQEQDQFEKERIAANKTQTVDTNTGKLTTQEDNLDLAKTAARKISEIAFQKSSSPDRSIETATSALGTTPFSPGAISSAIRGGAVGIKGDIKDIYSMTLDSLSKQKDSLKNASDYMMKLSQTPDLFALIDANELEFLKSTGYPPITFANKVAAYQAEHPEAIQNQVINIMNSYPDAGITPTDTLEQATAKMQNSRIYQQQTRLAGGGGSGESISSGSFLDVLQQSIDSGLSPQDAARAAAITSESLGIPVNQSQLDNWTNQASKLTKTPVIKTTANEKSMWERRSEERRVVEQFLNTKEGLKGFVPAYQEAGRRIAGGISEVGNFFSSLFGE